MFDKDSNFKVSPLLCVSVMQIALVDCGSDEKCIADLSLKAEPSVKR